MLKALAYLLGAVMTYMVFRKGFRESRVTCFMAAVIWPLSLAYLAWALWTSHDDGYF